MIATKGTKLQFYHLMIYYNSDHCTTFLIIWNLQTDLYRAKLAIELGRATHRTLLFVEESNDWDHVEVMDFAKKMDSGFARSFFVFTKFHEQVSKFSNQTELSQYFSKKPGELKLGKKRRLTFVECKCFFLSLLNQPTRLASIQADKYPDRLYQAYRRDISDLEKLKFDRR